MDKTGVLHHKSQSDQILHINSLNIRILNHVHSAVGAPFFLGISIRHYTDVQTIAYGSREQINFYISNLFILDLHFVDPTNTKEVFGKQEMFHPLLHSRSSFQMVDSDSSSGWVIDGKEQLKKYFYENDSR